MICKTIYQRGFTLIELMVATFAGMLLIAVIFSIMFQMAGMADQIVAKVRMNQEHREVFRLLANGGLENISGTIRYVPGVRGRFQSNANVDPTISRSNYTLNLSSNEDFGAGPTNPVLTSRTLTTPVSITCRGVNDPVPECVSGSETLDVTGYLATLGTDTAIDFNGKRRWATYRLKIFDPYLVNKKDAVASEYSSDMHFIFGLGRE
ncbi:MAG: hypothetical protein COB46_05920 [Rhodospirillaceae bacterium]|nr:MAG: hypothetical protein COB46_05920 [Rhodospirillaceae bacterium]